MFLVVVMLHTMFLYIIFKKDKLRCNNMDTRAEELCASDGGDGFTKHHLLLLYPSSVNIHYPLEKMTMK